MHNLPMKAVVFHCRHQTALLQKKERKYGRNISNILFTKLYQIGQQRIGREVCNIFSIVIFLKNSVDILLTLFILRGAISCLDEQFDPAFSQFYG